MNETICALGFFDGVHLGHVALLETCRHMAAERGYRAGVVTFSSHPDTLVLGSTPGLINTPQDRQWLLEHEFHMDRVVTLPFDEKTRGMDWKDFLDLLRRDYGAAGFVCGEDFRFGSRGAGTPECLARYCAENGLSWGIVPEQTVEGIRVSSTYIRKQLETGDMATAVRFLGHPHILSGQVRHGHQLGRTIGVPTANLSLPEGLAVPKFGVYVCRCQIGGAVYPAVTNIGTRPTVSGSGVTVESWILDYTGDLYGQEIRLEFYRFLRPERRFPTLEALRQAIRNDAEDVRRLLKQP